MRFIALLLFTIYMLFFVTFEGQLIYFEILIAVAWHELGHAAVARKCGVGVQEYSIGFGPKLLSWETPLTRYAFRLLPLGDYVDLIDWDDKKGDMSKEGARSRAPNDWQCTYVVRKPAAWRKVAGNTAGPVFNFILAGAILLVLGFALPHFENSLGRIAVSVGSRCARNNNGHPIRSESELVLVFSELRHGHSPGPHCNPQGFFAVVNIGLVAFNLLPIFPLDGGRIVKEFCAAIYEGDSVGAELQRKRENVSNIAGVLGIIGLYLIIKIQL